jgi:hypothetical protein
MYHHHKLLDLTRKHPGILRYNAAWKSGRNIGTSELLTLLTLWRQMYHTHQSYEPVVLVFHVSTEDALSSAEEEKYPLIMLNTPNHSHLLITRQILM